MLNGNVLKLVVVSAVIIIIVGILGVAALTQVEIDRDVSVTVLSDVDPNVAVRFELRDHSPAHTDYTAVGFVTDGQIELELHRILAAGGSGGFNPNATFVIGSAVYPVLRITNNSNTNITVSFVNVVPEGSIEVHAANGDPVAPGGSDQFWFTLNTPSELTDISAELRIRED